MHRTYMYVSDTYSQSSQIKADKSKTIVTFDTLLESKILDTDNIFILSILQKPWMIVCKDVDRIFEFQQTMHLTGQNYVNAP